MRSISSSGGLLGGDAWRSYQEGHERTGEALEVSRESNHSFYVNSTYTSWTQQKNIWPPAVHLPS